MRSISIISIPVSNILDGYMISNVGKFVRGVYYIYEIPMVSNEFERRFGIEIG